MRLSVALAAFSLLTPVSVVAAAPSPAPVPVSTLIRQVDIPQQSFTLPNGLRVYVHTDRKAPIVAVSVWYHVGSKDEPAGKTGFAHLFEHLMFNGSENAPGDFFEPLQQVGATDFNGTTWFDRTNYFETVPTPALERALFLEADRMGHLLGAMDQVKLDNQRGVVQNEKRQGDNEPYGLVQYAQLQALFPEGHPYRHSTIGSMADLDAASLEDVKQWFRDRYGPNNSVLVLAGDIDLATAKRLVTRYFGGIKRGPAVTPAKADVPTLAAPKSEVLKDAVATTRIHRLWAVPGVTDPDLVPLDMASSVLGGLSSSRLDNVLVRGEQLAVSVTAGVQAFERVSMFEVTADVRPGVDPRLVAQRLDAIIADLIRNGPTADEVQRVAMREVSGRIRGFESVGGFGGKATAIAEGALYANDPDFYKKQLAAYASATPAQIRAAAAKWLSRPVYSLTVEPGERSPYEEAKAGVPGARADAPPPVASAQPATPAAAAAADAKLPPVGEFADLKFPSVSHFKLSNGVDVAYAQRSAVPLTRVVASFDAGNAADPKDKLGLQSFMLSLIDEGTPTRNSIQIAEEQERLGASIGAGASMDRTTVNLSALSANLAPSLGLFSDILRNPVFAPAEVERVRAQRLAGIASEMTQPSAIALRTLPPLLYGTGHPYGIPFTGTGDPAVVAKVGRDDMAAFHRAWLRPDNMQMFVVSNLPADQVRAQLESKLGNWQAGGAKGTKNLDAPIPAAQSRIVLIDRPGSPQSVILAGQVLPVTGDEELITLLAANDVLGGNFLSRLNTDLREQKGWSYGVGASVNRVLGKVPYIVSAPVQADSTGPAIAALRDDMRMFLTSKGVTPIELERTINGSVRELPGSFETGSQVLSGMQRNALFQRPDDYYDTLADRYRALTAPQLDAAARAVIDPDKLLWVVVGDAAKVRPQLDALKLPVETPMATAKPAK
jgi:predicted Zn-dependent peptidase